MHSFSESESIPKMPITRRFHPLPWWRRWTKEDWTIAAVGLTVILFVLSVFSDSRRPQHFASLDAPLVSLSLVRDAKEKGALCLDGSAAGYHFLEGFGSGSDKWIVHIDGGGWCDTVESCSQRARTALGSSKYMKPQVPFSGMLSNDPSQNPDFFNWNKVRIKYCDGASLSGHPDSELNQEGKLFFRGRLIWKAIMDEVLALGMSGAKQALLSGCSAGGLATLIHCDDFKELLPKEASVKCVADAGFFLDEEDITGNRTIRSFYKRVVHLQGVVKSLNGECVAKMEPHKCFFPEEIVKHIRTPVFIVSPTYDLWQISNILVPKSADPNGIWRNCRLNIKNCSPDQLEVLHAYRGSMLKALSEFKGREGSGMFINSCFTHCQTWLTETWHSPDSPRLGSRTIAESVGDWYLERDVVKKIDCPYPCNPSCHNMILSSERIPGWNRTGP